MESLMGCKMRIVGTETDYYLIAPDGVVMNRILKSIYDNTGMRKNSFADLQVKKIFSDLFQCAVNLKYNYKKYYIQEYDSFQEFLYQKEMIEYELIEFMHLQENDALWKLRYDINSYSVKDIIGYKNENLLMFNGFLEGIQI